MKTRPTQHGYSLLELVIYIGLFALLSVILTQSLISVVRTYASAARYRALQNNGELIMELITREIRNTTTLTTSGCAVTTGTLSLTDTSNGSHTSVFSVTDQVLYRSRDGAAQQAVSTPEVTVSTFTICPVSTASVNGAKITLTLVTNDSAAVDATFYSTVYTRSQ